MLYKSADWLVRKGLTILAGELRQNGASASVKGVDIFITIHHFSE